MAAQITKALTPDTAHRPPVSQRPKAVGHGRSGRRKPAPVRELAGSTAFRTRHMLSAFIPSPAGEAVPT